MPKTVATIPMAVNRAPEPPARRHEIHPQEHHRGPQRGTPRPASFLLVSFRKRHKRGCAEAAPADLAGTTADPSAAPGAHLSPHDAFPCRPQLPNLAYT